jgi:hypothetical protein
MLIILTHIVQDETLCVLKHQNAAKHIPLTPIAHQLWIASRITHCDTKVVIIETTVIGHSRVCSGKYKNA